MREAVVENEVDEGDRFEMDRKSSPLVTRLGIASGDILLYVERHGRTSLKRLIRDLYWPATMTIMGVGALIRQGLLSSVESELEIVVEVKAFA